jgi:hypothetical protein
MEVVGSSQLSVPIYWSTWRHIPQNLQKCPFWFCKVFSAYKYGILRSSCETVSIRPINITIISCNFFLSLSHPSLNKCKSPAVLINVSHDRVIFTIPQTYAPKCSNFNPWIMQDTHISVSHRILIHGHSSGDKTAFNTLPLQEKGTIFTLSITSWLQHYKHYTACTILSP